MTCKHRVSVINTPKALLYPASQALLLAHKAEEGSASTGHSATQAGACRGIGVQPGELPGAGRKTGRSLTGDAPLSSSRSSSSEALFVGCKGTLELNTGLGYCQAGAWPAHYLLWAPVAGQSLRGLQAATKQGACTVDGAPCSPQRSPAGQLTGMDGSWPFPACHRGARPYAPCKHSAPLLERVRALPWSQQGVASCHASQPTAIGNLAKSTHPGPAARPVQALCSRGHPQA